VAGLEAAKQDLQITVDMPDKQPQLFDGGANTYKFILLYGPPGTGKTHLAKALAKEANRSLFIVSASDMMSKWVGDGERLVRLLFEEARKSRPAIIFFDEIDSVCGNRDRYTSTTSCHVNQKSELLVQMDGANHDNSGLLFVGATNLPWEIDPAFLRRFEKRIYVPLPDDAARKRIIQLQLGNSAGELEVRDWNYIVKKTEGFSGSDIKKLVKEAFHIRLREAQAAKDFVVVSFSRKLVASSADLQLIDDVQEWNNMLSSKITRRGRCRLTNRHKELETSARRGVEVEGSQTFRF
jgi:vacuolar protein-sorting-associated protein 4